MTHNRSETVPREDYELNAQQSFTSGFIVGMCLGAEFLVVSWLKDSLWALTAFVYFAAVAGFMYWHYSRFERTWP